MTHMPTQWEMYLRHTETERDLASLGRSLRTYSRRGKYLIDDTGAETIDFSSNDYLGLSTHKAIAEAARSACDSSIGAGASRLIVGSSPAVSQLESALGRLHDSKAALVFGSGYLANIGVISSLAGRGDVVFADSLNHASIWDGLRLSGARFVRYDHCDMDHLRSLLIRERATKNRRALIITESLFSMDGDIAPLRDIVSLKEEFEMLLMVDEAHADGVFGNGGRGLANQLAVSDEVDIHVGTLSKAYGSVGGYVLANQQIIRHLVNSARSFIYTTALPIPVLAASVAAIEIAEGSDQLRGHLFDLSSRLRAGLSRLGIETSGSTSQIVPLTVGSSERALELSRYLESQGVLAFAIRPPTVPKEKSRLRISLTARHALQDINNLLDLLGRAL